MSGSKVSRRRFLKYAVAGGAAVVAGAVGYEAYQSMGGQAAQTGNLPKSITLLLPGGTWQQYYDQVYGAVYKQKYGVDVVYDAYSADYAVRLMTNKANPVDDVAADAESYSNTAWVQQGLVQKINAGNVPNLGDVIAAAKSDYFAGRIIAPFGLAYNASKVPGGVMHWKDLDNPNFVGKIAIPAWEWGNYGQQWVNFINKAIFNGNEDNIDQAIQFCSKLVHQDQAKLISTVDQGMQLFTQEQIRAAPFFSARAYSITANGGPKMGFVYPTEGTMGFYYGSSIVSGIPDSHVKASELEINLELDPQLLSNFCQLTKYAPTSQKALDLIPADFKTKNPSLNMKPEDLATFSVVKLDPIKMRQNASANLLKWQKEVLGS